MQFKFLSLLKVNYDEEMSDYRLVHEEADFFLSHI